MHRIYASIQYTKYTIMKTLLSILALLFLVATTNAQTASIAANLKQAGLRAGLNNGYNTYQTYTSDNVKGSQFFYPGFKDGSVITTNNEVITGLYQFLFDKVRQQLFITAKADKRPQPEVLLAEKDQIKSFTITTDREHTFVAARNYDPANTNDFYEVLKKDDSGYSLLKLVKTTFEKMDYKDLQKVKRGDIYDEFVDKVSYYVSYKSGKPQEISFKKKNMPKAFQPDKKAFVENYTDMHGTDDVDEQYLINLVFAANN